MFSAQMLDLNCAKQKSTVKRFTVLFCYLMAMQEMVSVEK